MKVGTMRLQPRTVKGICYAAGSVAFLVVGSAICLLVTMILLPASQDAFWR